MNNCDIVSVFKYHKYVGLKILELLSGYDFLNFCASGIPAISQRNISAKSKVLWRHQALDVAEYVTNLDYDDIWVELYEILFASCQELKPSLALATSKRNEKIIDLLSCINPSPSYLGWGLKGAAEIGDMALIFKFIKKGARQWSLGAWGAAMGGNTELMNYFLEETTWARTMCMTGAAEGGHMDIIRSFSKGNDICRFDYYMRFAALGCRQEVIDFFMERGITESGLTSGFYGAIEGGHLYLVKFFMEKKKEMTLSEINEGLEIATKHGREKVIDFLLDSGADNLGLCVEIAYSTCRFDLYYKMMEMLK